MNNFVCPVCGKQLIDKGKSYFCENGHNFDKAKSGYVNLLLAQSHKTHGDDKLMVVSRRNFLDKGFYRPLLDEITAQVNKYAKNGCTILDSGCGEGWYSANIFNSLICGGIFSNMLAVDISKEALNIAGKRSKDIRFAVASAYELPVANECCDIVISLFAPLAREEFLRVMKTGAAFITAFPLEEHLWELKAAVYDSPYKNEVADFSLDGFRCVSSIAVKGKIRLESNEDIRNLFSMTPYYYKTSENDQKKLNSLNSLETQIQFAVVVYEKL